MGGQNGNYEIGLLRLIQNAEKDVKMRTAQVKNAQEKATDVTAAGGRERTFELNFANPEHQENFYSRYGGKEVMEREFPKLAELAERTIRAAEKEGARRCVKECAGEYGDRTEKSSSGVLGHGDLHNGIKIREMGCTASMWGASGIASLRKITPRLYMSLTLMQGETVLKRERQFLHNVTDSVLNCTMSPPGGSGKADGGNELICVLNVTWEDGETNLLKDYTRTATAVIWEDEVVKSLELYHPCLYHPNISSGQIPMPALHFIQENVNPPAKQPLDVPSSMDDPDKRTSINVCYMRLPGQGDVSDYVYNEGRIGGEQMTFLDIRGQVLFNDGKELDEIKDVDIILDCVGDGLISYKSAPVRGVHIYDTATAEGETGFCFVLPTYWNATIPNSVMAGNRKYYLEADISFTCKESQQVHTVSISSRDKVVLLEQHMAEIKPIRMFWGCVAEGTRVRMADGCEIMIEHLCPGDRAADIQGGGNTVADVIRGMEEMLYVIRAEGRREIRVSGEHPFLTEKGWKPAMELTAEDRLMMEDGSYAQVEEHYMIQYGGTVYNLYLEGAPRFIAEGYVVGDNEQQGACMRDTEEKERVEMNKEILEEIEKLKKLLG